MKIEYHPQARIEALDAADYIEAHRPGYGSKFKDEVDEGLEILTREPRLWAIRLYGFRRYITPLFKYQVWYREKQGLIYIIAVHHSSRKPGYWKKRI